MIFPKKPFFASTARVRNSLFFLTNWSHSVGVELKALTVLSANFFNLKLLTPETVAPEIVAPAAAVRYESVLTLLFVELTDIFIQ